MVLLITVFGIIILYGFIRYIFFKKKIHNEDEKREYLEKKYNHLLNSIDPESNRKITEIEIEEPYNEKEKWKVELTLKSSFPLGFDSTVVIFEISDKDLELENPLLGRP